MIPRLSNKSNKKHHRKSKNIREATSSLQSCVGIKKASIHHLISLKHNFALRILYKNFTVDKLVMTSLVTILNSELRLIKFKISRFVFERKMSIPQNWLRLLVVIKVNLDQKITGFFSLHWLI